MRDLQLPLFLSDVKIISRRPAWSHGGSKYGAVSMASNGCCSRRLAFPLTTERLFEASSGIDNGKRCSPFWKEAMRQTSNCYRGSRDRRLTAACVRARGLKRDGFSNGLSRPVRPEPGFRSSPMQYAC